MMPFPTLLLAIPHLLRFLRRIFLLVFLPTLVATHFRLLKLSEEELLREYACPDLVSGAEGRGEKIAWVVAHPDDETVFFGPSLANLLQEPSLEDTPKPIQNQGHILVLSNGNNDKLGYVREKEMLFACSVWDIPPQRCLVINDPDLPDSQSANWDHKRIRNLTTEVLSKQWGGIDKIITFDDYGVSGHSNHRAVGKALVNDGKGLSEEWGEAIQIPESSAEKERGNLQEAEGDAGLRTSILPHTPPPTPKIFTLTSHSFFLKYTSLVSLPLSTFFHQRHGEGSRLSSFFSFLSPKPTPHDDRDPPHPFSPSSSLSPSFATSSSSSCRTSLFLSPHSSQHGKIQRAFAMHVSQGNWWRRWGWMVYSRFVWVNQVVRMVG